MMIDRIKYLKSVFSLAVKPKIAIFSVERSLYETQYITQNTSLLAVKCLTFAGSDILAVTVATSALE